MKSHVGKPDPKYGGVVTNVCALPVGTKFYVRNGAWAGCICQDDISKYIKIEGCSPKRFKDDDEEYLAIELNLTPYSNEITQYLNIPKENNDEMIRIEVIKNCSVCKHNNSNMCNLCYIAYDNAIPSHFLADVSKINPYFIDSYYELLNKYTQLLKSAGIDYKLDIFDIGD